MSHTDLVTIIFGAAICLLGGISIGLSIATRSQLRIMDEERKAQADRRNHDSARPS